MTKFRTELEGLINSHCMENGSDTPDYILAKYLDRCLDNFNQTISDREEHYGRKLWKDQPKKTCNAK